MLSDKTKTIVKSTLPLLREKGENITTHMYELLFAKHPEAKQLFSQAPKGQPRVLASAIISYCNNIDNLVAMEGAVEMIARRHVFSGVKPEHYPFVGEALLQAMQEVLGEQATSEVMTAWEEAYTFLADVLIKRESELYASTY